MPKTRDDIRTDYELEVLRDTVFHARTKRQAIRAAIKFAYDLLADRVTMRLLLALVFLWSAPPALAQTRFYLPSTGTPSVSPAFGADWEDTSNAVRLALVTTRITSPMALVPAADAAATNDKLIVQFVKCGLNAQTIDGSVKGQIRAVATHSASLARIAFRIAKSDSAGGNIVDILAWQEAGSGSTPPLFVISPTTETNRPLEGTVADAFSHTLTSTSASAGDCLIIELGANDDSANTARFGQLVIGDNNATDLPEDETTTAVNNPWIEFSDTITFGGAAVSPRLTLLGVGSR